MNRRSFFMGAAAAAVTPFALARSGNAEKLPQDGVAWFTDVEVTAQDGRSYKFYDDLLRGKIVLVNFFFTRCDATCPLVMENLAAVQELLGPRIGRDIFMYSITLQPEIDTPELLAAYARTYDAGPGWLLLTGRSNDIELLRHRLGFVEFESRRGRKPRGAYRRHTHRRRADAPLDHESRVGGSEGDRRRREAGNPGTRLGVAETDRRKSRAGRASRPRSDVRRTEKWNGGPARPTLPSPPCRRPRRPAIQPLHDPASDIFAPCSARHGRERQEIAWCIGDGGRPGREHDSGHRHDRPCDPQRNSARPAARWLQPWSRLPAAGGGHAG